jgi:glutamate synthase (ferredoxin)
VLDERGDAGSRVNPQMVDLERVADATEAAALRLLVENHLERTSSSRARQLLDAWDVTLPKFVKIIPRDYKRMLAAIARAEEQGLVGDEAIMVAFEENARDLSRVGGN